MQCGDGLAVLSTEEEDLQLNFEMMIEVSLPNNLTSEMLERVPLISRRGVFMVRRFGNLSGVVGGWGVSIPD